MSPQAGFDTSTVTAGGGSSPTLRGFWKWSSRRSEYISCSNDFNAGNHGGRGDYPAGWTHFDLPEKRSAAARPQVGISGRQGGGGGELARGAGARTERRAGDRGADRG